MDDKQQIEALYLEMYQAMIAKDTATLNRIHADDFELTHMTGMHQLSTPMVSVWVVPSLPSMPPSIMVNYLFFM